MDSEHIVQRQLLKRNMPNVKLGLKHTQNGKLLPDRTALLENLPKQKVVAEIGVADGDFSNEILLRCAPERLHLVDSWDSNRYIRGKESVYGRFGEGISAGTISVHEGLSVDVLNTFEDGYFDWVYLDSNHSYTLTASELNICEKKVNPNGRICGHDFCVGNIMTPVVYGVIQAVNEFCVTREWQYEFLTLESHGHFSFSLKRLKNI